MVRTPEMPVRKDWVGEDWIEAGRRNAGAGLGALSSTPLAFEEIVSLFTVRLQGGQMRLEARFLSRVPLPDVTDEMSCPARVVKELVDLW